MRSSQALIQRSRSLLKASRASVTRSVFPPAPPRSKKNPLSRTPPYSKRIASSATTSPVTTSEPPPLESPSDAPEPSLIVASPPDPPPEEPEKSKRKLKTSTPKEPKEPSEPPLELPEGLALEILWRPESDPGPSNRGALPPPEIFDEALHNLHITLHPQTQHRATYASPIGPLLEPTLALYCPIEGGEYVIDATVRELARRTDAEVLVLDAVQLAAGEWGAFGKAANSLQLSRNPLHFHSAHPRPVAPDEEDDDPEPSSAPFNPGQLTLTLLSPPGRSVPSRRNGPPSKLQLFFEAVVNTSSSEEQSDRPRPRLVYIRDFPTLAPSSSAWYPPLLSSVRSRRRQATSRSPTPVTHPMTIVFGMTPSLIPTASAPPSAPPAPMNPLKRPQRTISGAKQPEADWSEDDASNRARERRLRERLQRWEKGDGLQDEFPKLSAALEGEGEGSSEQGPGIIIIGPTMVAHRNFGNRDSDSVFFRTSVLLPSVRSLDEERASRSGRRREINELTMRMGVGAVGGVVDKEGAATSVGPSQESEADANPSNEPGPKKKAKPSMWEDWGNRIEIWPAVRAVADRAVGSAAASMDHTAKRTLDATPVDWPAINGAWAAHRASRNLRKTWMKEASNPSKSTPREQDEDEGEKEDDEDDVEEVDELIERLKNDPTLDPHEHRLLPCIVNSASMRTTFSQVHLPPHTIDSIRTIVSLPLLHPQAFQQGILKEHSMTGCLLFGPPGTGKTLVVRALAKETGVAMMVISPADVMDMYVGEGEKLVKAVFSLARKIAPCVVFLDEIDALFGARVSGRESGGAFAHRGVITEFMQEMDGLRTSNDDSVIIIGATNRPFDLDDAVLRRLPRRLLVDLPGEPEREGILKILLRDETLGPDVDPKIIAKKTESFSGSDLKHLCVSAALDAVKENFAVPWSSATTPSPQNPPASDASATPGAEPSPVESPTSVEAESEPPSNASASGAEPSPVESPTSVEAENEPLSSDSTADDVPPPSTAPRILHLRHFTKALKEISPSSSEVLGSLADLRKWNEEFGEGRGNKKRQQVWGKGRFGFTEQSTDGSEDGRVLPADRSQR
ncbi:hypothetical protein B0H17DRAFT_1030021 [Mycena rosella]|uniref:AAA+ ATPase domain-containing protein n=1 Tax=Mycena rosella TaxID=1033263 RepID=A0AAD7MBY4_MYCRO|nr:hypothetical protein B0H17DRAFT_1030021 [Mycena rosella]